MNSPILGFYQPGTGWLYRIPLGVKYLLLLALSIPAFVISTWWWSLGALALTLAILLSGGVGLAHSLKIGWFVVVFIAMLAIYHLITGRFTLAVTAPGNLCIAILAARIVTLTTPVPAIIDAVAKLADRIPRVDGERVGLAVAIMLRSVPRIIGSIDEARDAARARGIGPNPIRYLVPVMLSTVAYAEHTGEALAARGIGDR